MVNFAIISSVLVVSREIDFETEAGGSAIGSPGSSTMLRVLVMEISKSELNVVDFNPVGLDSATRRMVTFLPTNSFVAKIRNR